MRTRWLIALGVIAAVAAGVGWWLERPKPVRFITTPATKGDVVRAIVATGTVNPVATVQVGTYVSGVIRSIACDYNTKVKAVQVNLDYTDIVSPVNGTVVSRNVDVGQTVAASFQTPTLFLIAQDLTKMQVDTNVGESDIGGVRVGQKASFTVLAFPNMTFQGRVSQVREAPITVQNVVTYDAVINVSNPKLLLLPGMTANARIITEERRDVLKVPLQALRFEPQGLPPLSARDHEAGGRPCVGSPERPARVGSGHHRRQ